MKWTILGTTALCLLACGRAAPLPVSEVRGGEPGERHVTIAPRTPFLATYPCGEQCHDGRQPDPRPRALTLFHAGRRIDHGPAIGWCDRCHAIDDPDLLVDLDGRPVSFDESDRVCASCHGERHRDWSQGIHGLSTGGWRGDVQRRLCTACHDPHAPGRIHLESLPPPLPDPRVHDGARHEGAGHEGAGHEGAGHEGAGHEEGDSGEGSEAESGGDEGASGAET